MSDLRSLTAVGANMSLELGISDCFATSRGIGQVVGEDWGASAGSLLREYCVILASFQL